MEYLGADMSGYGDMSLYDFMLWREEIYFDGFPSEPKLYEEHVTSDGKVWRWLGQAWGVPETIREVTHRACPGDAP